MLPYTVFAFVALLGFCSLALDWGYVQITKTELQRCADATAHGYMAYYQLNGQAYADANGPSLYGSGYNPVASGSGFTPTVTVQWGQWVAASNTFNPGGGGGSTTAIKVTASRSTANGNPIRLFWASILGQNSTSMTATAIATLSGGSSTTTVTIPSTANPYLAGMPAGSTAMYGDTTTNAGALQVTGIPVTPGTWITLTSVSGSTNVLPGYVSSAGPDGLTSIPVHHGQNYDYSINAPGPENGVADAVMYESSFMGMFLDNNRPDATAAPATVVDWTQPSAQNQANYTNLAMKQPFFIGDGQTSGGTVQKFLVPQGATRLYLGIWDGVGYYNNSGSLTATITVQPGVTLVR